MATYATPRQSIKRRRREIGNVCGNRVIFSINKHKSSASRVSLSAAHHPYPRASIDYLRIPRVVTVVARMYVRTHAGDNGDNYVFRGHKRGGTRGTSQPSVETRAAAIRHPTE